MDKKPLIYSGIALILLLISAWGPSLPAEPGKSEILRLTHLIEDEGGSWPSISSEELAEHIVALGRNYELDPVLVLAMIKVESNFQSNARSQMGALGLMQVMPIVIREVGGEVNVQNRNDLLDPLKNVHIGIHYLALLRDRYRNNLHRALAAYNVGPTQLDFLIASQNHVPRRYYSKVMQFYHSYQRKLSSWI